MQWIRKNGPILLAILSMLGPITLFVAGAVASAKVDPVEQRVSKLEAHREDDSDRLERIENKVDELLRRK